MPFDERTDWRDTPSAPPPPGSTPVHATDILRWERGLAVAHQQLDGRLSEEDLNATYVLPVTHGANADYPRPAGAGMVIWTGTVRPNNMVGADLYIAPSDEEVPPPAPAGWVPSEILSDWHSYVWAESMTNTDSEALATIPDGSGNGRSFGDFDADTTRRPVFATSEPQLAGKKAIVFDGTNDVVKTAEFGAVAQPWSFAIIGYAPNTATLSSFFDAESGTASRGRHQRDTNNIHNLYAGTSLQGTTATKFLMYGEFNGATSKLNINGVEYTGNSGTVNSFTRLYLGARRDATWPSPLRLAFFGVVPRAFTGDEATAMKTRAAQTYGVSIA
ncbi:hypothetical protein ACRAJ3_09665 [Rhodococcus pyridinivorans]|uniref:hypothetical protein n=1 Tax=Rhodococcus pyridinivorans TaxID=103816 RepID=UPI003D7F4457